MNLMLPIQVTPPNSWQNSDTRLSAFKFEISSENTSALPQRIYAQKKVNEAT
jgi:hypothetical protein